jgi:phosphoglycolate phosphatase-like HAD superfamily hydrolase
MLLDAAKELGLDLSRSWMVGDRWRDVDCGKRAGVRTVFIDYGYSERIRPGPTSPSDVSRGRGGNPGRERPPAAART